MNCPRKHGKPSNPKVEFNIDKSRPGNKVVEGDGKKGMEYKQVKGKPIGDGRIVDWPK